MRNKIILTGVLLATFILGGLFEGYVKPQLSSALSPPNTAAVSTPAPEGPQGEVAAAPETASTPTAPTATSAPAASPVSSTAATRSERASYQGSRVRRHHHRSWERQVLIVAGSAGAGTAIGALAGGGKGAGIGAISGGVAGLVYNLASRH